MKIKLLSCICIVLCTCLILCTGCNSSQENTQPTKQSATAYIYEDNVKTAVKVDLTDGWSVEFASGAVYLYDKEIKSDIDAIAMCISLDKNVYNEYLNEAKSDDSYKITKDYIYYETTDASEYLCKFNKAYFKISVYDKTHSNEIFNRFSFKPNL